MLPDFIKVKREIEEGGRLDEPRDAILSQIRKTIINEGNRRTVHRADGTFDTADFKHFSAAADINLQEVQSEGEVVLEKARLELQKRMMAENKEHFIKFFVETVEEAGNAFDAKDQLLSAELMLKSYENMEFSFDRNGRWKIPTPIFHPVQKVRFDQEWKRLHTEPELKRRMNELIFKKKEEWNVRQANRKLVD